ncbi:hypothetical protein V496_00236 [Pseudogymnoascus sp. VKM F-4515 (FW-2607)]|nr:hypothetical protein V496_00236 [Pseudogymnoascus sp. VKM F-4515 (FW-2607)]
MATGAIGSRVALQDIKAGTARSRSAVYFSLNYAVAEQEKGIGSASASLSTIWERDAFVNANKGRYQLMDPNKSSAADSVTFISTGWSAPNQCAQAYISGGGTFYRYTFQVEEQI